MTPTEEEMVVAELNEGGDPSKIARRYGLPYQVVRDLKAARYRCSEDGLGRFELRRFLVAIRPADNPNWTCLGRDLEQARQQYDEGTVDMATGRDGHNLLLYVFPRVTPDPKRRVYFARNFSDG